MKDREFTIDLVKLALYILKRCWLILICAAIGFGFMYWRSSRRPDTYTASGTMYVYNANPNLVNYGYTNMSDLSSAVMLVDTYAQVVKSNRVLDAIVERMTPAHPGITSAAVSGSLNMATVNETGVVRVSSRTKDPVLSADIVNTALDVAPNEIKRVVGAGEVEVIDYATTPMLPDGRQDMRRGLIGALAGAVAAAALLLLLFLMNRKIDDADELRENYTLPVLASIRRHKGSDDDPGAFVISSKSSMEDLESYAKLRMNLLYTLVDKESKSVAVVSTISGEGKSTISANLAISLGMSGKRVLLIDADLRRGCQQELFYYDKHLPGLSDVLAHMKPWQETILETQYQNLEIMPAGHLPPNPAELLQSEMMKELLQEVETQYDLVLLDAPPINIVADPLALSDRVAGAIFVVRQNFSDHREIRRALTAAEMTGMTLLGFVFYGENMKQGSYYYNKKYYKSYYHKYDTRHGRDQEGTGDTGQPGEAKKQSVPKKDGTDQGPHSGEKNTQTPDMNADISAGAGERSTAEPAAEPAGEPKRTIPSRSESRRRSQPDSDITGTKPERA